MSEPTDRPGLYELVESMPDGKGRLAEARLSRTIEVILHKAGIAEPRRWLRTRSIRSLTVAELAQLLEAAGLELDVKVLPYGELARRVASGRGSG